MAESRLRTALGRVRAALAAQACPPESDATLLKRFAAGQDEAAFAALVQRHGAMVRGVCRRMLGDAHDAEDAWQATFLILVRRAAAIRRRESVGSWLYGVAYRVAREHREARARRRTQIRPTPDVPQAGPEGEVSLREVLTALDEELNRMPEPFRAPLVLCYLEGLTRDEAALRLGWSPGAVRGRLERGTRSRCRGRSRRAGRWSRRQALGPGDQGRNP